MTKHLVADIRNVALVGHGAVGKTTLADLMLFKAGIGSRAGSVDDHTSVFDSDEDEKHRKLSITSAVGHFQHAGKRVNVIDTPGYPDFIGQVIGALRAVETAVVTLSATAGIEVNTRRVFHLAGNAGIGRMILVNKCDLDNINYDRLITLIQETFGGACVPINLPVGLGPNFSGVVSTLNVPASVPDGVPTDLKTVNQTLMDAIVEADEALLERYLEGQQLTPEEISSGLRKAVAAGTLIPVLFTSSKTGTGVPEFMNALATYALAPTDVERKAKNAAGEEVVLSQTPEAPLVAHMSKTRIDPFVARMSFLRIFSGSLKKDMMVHASHAAKAMKIGQIMEVQGSGHGNVNEASAGDIVVLVKMEELHVGDTITKDAHGFTMPPITYPTPMIGLAVEPKSRADQQKISGALQKIVEEDRAPR